MQGVLHPLQKVLTSKWVKDRHKLRFGWGEFQNVHYKIQNSNLKESSTSPVNKSWPQGGILCNPKVR